MRARYAAVIVAFAFACAASHRAPSEPGLLDDPRFAPREITPESIAAPRRADFSLSRPLSLAERIDDERYLESALAALGIELDRGQREQLRQSALEPGDTGGFCWRVRVQGVTSNEACGNGERQLMKPVAAPAADIPAYTWRLDRAADGSEVAIVTIKSFVAPSDPRWAGFGEALRGLATTRYAILDLRGAAGDDPRVAAAVLRALGVRLDAAAVLQPPVFHDGPVAVAARAAFAAEHADVHARSRDAWTAVSTDDQLVATARSVTERFAPGLGFAPVVAHIDELVLLDRDTGIAGELVAHVAAAHNPKLVSFPSAPVGRIRADEWATIRLPSSGLDVEVATVRYAAPFVRPLVNAYAIEQFDELVAWMHRDGARRAQVAANVAGPRPSCAALPRDPAALRRKYGTCRGRDSGEYFVKLALPAKITTTYLYDCLGLVLATAPIEESPEVGSTVFVKASQSGLERLAASPFVDRIEQSCVVGVAAGA